MAGGTIFVTRFRPNCVAREFIRKWSQIFWGTSKVNLAMDVYDRTDMQDFVQPLALVVNELFPSCSPAEVER